MIALLDANILIALFDTAHLRHRDAHDWLAANRQDGWATCPLTQNACVRIMSQANYPGNLAVVDIAGRLRRATSTADHSFWPDDFSLLDLAVCDHTKILTARHLTDIYLVAMAVQNGGCLVTFDRKIPTEPVVGVGAKHVVVV